MVLAREFALLNPCTLKKDNKENLKSPKVKCIN